jgi:hypothetical protein
LREFGATAATPACPAHIAGMSQPGIMPGFMGDNGNGIECSASAIAPGIFFSIEHNIAIY